MGERYVQSFVSRNTRVILISEALIKTKTDYDSFFAFAYGSQ